MMSIKALIAGTLMTAGVMASPAEAATIMFDFSFENVSRVNGSFSFDDAKTGVLGYADLTAFDLTIVGDAVTAASKYTLADVLAMPVYSFFSFDASQYVLNTGVADGPFGPVDLFFGAAAKSANAGPDQDLDSGFVVGTAGAYRDFRTDFAGGIDSVSLSVAAVPEPATWAMMLVGFALVGAATRYRRRTTTVAFG